jgi:hypothetical protein
MTLLHLFNAPITLADLHYFTPTSHLKWQKIRYEIEMENC